MHERVERAIAAIVPGEVIEMPAGRRVQVLSMPDGTICRMGHRIAVRNYRRLGSLTSMPWRCSG